MADNPYFNHVELADGTTVMDIRDTTASPSDVIAGQVFYKANGERSVGTLSIVDSVYPVGSIYMSVSPTSPGELFGGTWAQLKDKFLLGAGDTYTAGDTGGAASVSYTPAGTNSGGSVGSHTLTTDEIPSHSHGLNSHTHSVGAHSHGLNSHTHSVGAHSHGLNSHKHSVGAHSHGLNSHTHTINHGHGFTKHTVSSSGGGGYVTFEGYLNSTKQKSSTSFTGSGVASGNNNYAPFIDSGGYAGHYLRGTIPNHTHTLSGGSVTDYSGSSGAASGSTANSTAFDSGAASGSTANSTAFNSGAATGNTTSSGGGGGHTHGFTNPTFSGTKATINTMPPYLVVYMWKRTA